MLDAFKFFPIKKCHKSKIGSVSEHESVTISVHCRADIFLSSVRLCAVDDESGSVLKVDMKNEGGGEYHIYSCILTPNKRGLYWYYFECMQESHKFYISCDENLQPISDSKKHKLWQLTVANASNKQLDWFKGGNMYHIFVDRFAIGGERLPKKYVNFHDNLSDCPDFLPVGGKILNNDFFGGNFKGITEKLPYISELGINIIYLSPIFQAASNHRYDTSDYENVDELLGTIEDLKVLISSAKEYGIEFVIDGVFNHIGDDSKYFNKYAHFSGVGAYQSQASPYIDWFNFTEYPNKYESWWGIDTLPSVNQNNVAFRDYIAGESGILNKWLSLGIKGVRLDVVDEIRDIFLDDICERVNACGDDNIIIGEVWEDASNKTAYGVRRRYFQGGQLDSVMNYPLKDGIISFVKSGSADMFVRAVHSQINNYPKAVLDCVMNVLGTHDTARILTALSDSADWRLSRVEKSWQKLEGDGLNVAISRLKIAALIQFTCYGVPCIYYGDEVGMQGYEDPFNRRFFDWNNIDKGLLDWYKFLCGLRKRFSVFKEGDFNFLKVTNSGIAYSRGEGNEIIVAVNLGGEFNFKPIDNYRNLIDGNDVSDICLVAGEFGIYQKIQ